MEKKANFLSLGVGTFTANERMKQLVMEVLNTNRLSYGPMMQKFEAEFAKMHGCRFGIMSNSGTSALQLALQAMKEIHRWDDDDEVIVPALTFVATANIVLHNRMKPILVDIESNFYGINPELIEAAITPKTRAIIPVHLFGQPADMDPINKIAQNHGLKVIEDSAETMFASYKGKRVGALGDIGCFSTYVAHLLVTGVGGLNTTNNPEYAIKIRSLLNHGRDSIYLNIDDDKNKTMEELLPIIERRFKFTSIGHSFRVTELEAALGLGQLDDCIPNIEKRRNNARVLTEELAKFSDDIQLPQIRENCEHSFMMYPIVLRNGTKQKLVNYLESQGIETRDMLPLTNQPVYHNLLGWKEEDYSIAHWVNDSGFYIGCHQDFNNIELEYIVKSFNKFFKDTQELKSNDKSCLILLVTERTPSDFFKSDVPDDLFNKVIILVQKQINIDLNKSLRKNTEVIQIDLNDPVQFIIDSDIVTEQNIVVFPCDGQWNLKDIPRILMQLKSGNDLVIASRFMVGGERRILGGPIRSFGNRFFNLLVSMLFGGNVSDSFSSLKGFKKEKFLKLRIQGNNLARNLSFSIYAVKNKLKIQEIPTIENNKSYKKVLTDITSIFSSTYVLISEKIKL